MNGEEAYVLSKSLVTSVVAGVSNYSISNDGILSFETSDGRTLTYQFHDIGSVELDENNHLKIKFTNGTVTDAGEVPTAKGDDGRGIVSITKTSTVGNVDTYTILYTDNTTSTFQVTNGGGGGSSELQDDLTTSLTVGGIKTGTTYAAGTSLEQLFRDLLNPVAYPTLTNPSASLSATGAKLIEAGSTLNTTFTLTLNRGSINPQYTADSSYRSGPATTYTFDGETKTAGTFSRTITSAKTSYQGSVAYEAGCQPKDSTGKNYSTPLPAGSVNSNTVTYEFVDAMWSNVASIGTIAKMALVSKTAKQRDLGFPAQTTENPEVFDIPSSWTVTAVQVKNDLSGVYEDAMSQFTVTNVTHDDAAGSSVDYKRYTFNLGYDTGARSVRVKWS